MERKRFEHMEKWLLMKKALKEKGYSLWQTQYDWDSPEGYIAGFMKDDKRLEIVTHNKEIEADIIHSGL
ncbi:MAG TPA: hypothetical protein DEB10_11720 [Ruminococcaceae bacterium]|jgi:hypothetical protein|nr:hypothetical protein [Oscillospiraceae bacterium]